MCFVSNRALRLRFVFGAAACALVSVSAAQAQPWGFEFGPLGPRVYAPEYPGARSQAPRRSVAAALAAQGYQLLGPLERNGPVFRAPVEDVRGRAFRVIVDARSGQVLERFPLRSGPPRPPADIGRRDKFAPGAVPRIDDFDEGLARAPLPDDPRLAPGAPKAADKPASRPVKSASVPKKPAAPKPEQSKPAQQPVEKVQEAPAAEASAPAPSAAPARNANLRRPDVPQREPFKPDASIPEASKPTPAEAASRPAPRVVYPGPTGE